MFGLSVLVIQPNERKGRSLVAAIRANGHDAQLVSDGERAIDQFIQEPADVVVVDLFLAGRDGEATVTSLRVAPRGEQLQVILTCSRPGFDERTLARVAQRMGVVEFFPAPLSERDVAEAVETLAESTTEAGSRFAPPSEVMAGAVITGEHRVEGDATNQWSTPESGSGQYEEIEDAALEWIDDTDGALEVQAIDRVLLAKSEGDFNGNLSAMPFPALLCWLADRRASGALVLTATGASRRAPDATASQKVVYFRSGVPVYVHSNLTAECLGHVLARAGAISPDALEDSVRRLRAEGGRQGEILVAMGELTNKELQDGLETQLRVKLYDLFGWSTGTFHFHERVPSPKLAVTLEMGLTEIVFRGVSYKVPPQRLLDLLRPNLDRFVVPDQDRASRFLRLDLIPEARKVLVTLDGTRRLRNLLSLSGDRPGAVAQLLYSMQCLTAITFEEQAHPVQTMSERLEPGPDVLEGGVVSDPSVLRNELERLSNLLRGGRYAEALHVSVGDQAAAGREAERLAARYQPITMPGAAPRDLRALAFEVCARLVNIQRALSEGRVPADLGLTAVGLRPKARDAQDEASPGREPPAGGSRVGDGTRRERPPGPASPPHRSPDGTIAASARGRLKESSSEALPSLESVDPPASARPRSSRDRSSLEATTPRVSAAPDEVPDAGLTVARPPPRAPESPSEAEHTIPRARPPRAPIPSVGEDPAPAPAPPERPESTDGLTVARPPPAGPLQMPPRARATVPTNRPPRPDVHDAIPLERRRPGPESAPQGTMARQDPLLLDEQVQQMFRAERHFRAGERAMRKNRYEEALAAFAKAARLYPEEGEFLAHLGYARFIAAGTDERNGRQALDELRRARELSPARDMPHVLYARALRELGDVQGARDAYQQALQANPGCEEAHKGLKSLP